MMLFGLNLTIKDVHKIILYVVGLASLMYLIDFSWILFTVFGLLLFSFIIWGWAVSTKSRHQT